ncbi:hypothetical protein ACOQFV_27450 [Nocardiopsis changdeensis]|uniref:hypothetical protein n=1 Tax=Nocardiopsis TaxID=2013 RepID=UPI002407F53E|nr:MULTISPECIES: hypothetical protein [Nocardiopsis]
MTTPTADPAMGTAPYKVGDRVRTTAPAPSTPGFPADYAVPVGTPGTIANIGAYGGYGVLLDNDPHQLPAHYDADELVPAGTMFVLGLDLSLTSTGVASSLGWAERIRPRQLRGLERLRYIRERITGYARPYSLAVLEGPAYGRATQAGHDEMAALRWMVRDDLDRLGVPVAIIPPSTLKLWATGRGNADKVSMTKAMSARFPDVEITSSDEADALALADMGNAWATAAPLTPAQGRAVQGATWPEVITQ